MDYPGSESEAASAFNLESFFFASCSDQKLDDAAADPGFDLARGPQTCAPQVICTPSLRKGVGVTLSLPQQGTGFPVSSSVWATSDIARVHASLQPSRSAVRSGMTFRPTTPSPSPRSPPTSELGFPSSGFPTSRPAAAFSPPTAPSAGLHLSPSLGLPVETSFDPLLHPSAGCPIWMPKSDSSERLLPAVSESDHFALRPPVFDTTPNPSDAFCDGKCLISSLGYCGTPSVSVPRDPLPTYVETSEDAPSTDNGKRSPQVFVDRTVSGPVVHGSLSPKGEHVSSVRVGSQSPLSIIQYKPGGDTQGNQSRKRQALEEVTSQGIVPQTLQRVFIEGKDGEVQGAMITFGKRVRTRASFTKEKREQTAQARRQGVCGRCKRSKRQCDLAQKDSPYVSCTLCASTKLYKGVPRMPCFKSTLTDILFFRSGPAPNEPFFTKRSEIYDLVDLSDPNAPVRTLTLTQHIEFHRLTVYASEFTPQPGDVVSYKWHDPAGNRREFVMPNFCLTNLEKIRVHLRRYIESTTSSFLALLRGEDELAWMTVAMAMQYARGKPDCLVRDALNLWVISRVIEIPWEMCGSDTLGVSPIDDVDNPQHGRIPIPPNMDTQLDQIVIQHFLQPLRARLLQRFEQRITPPKPEVWFDIYLTAFVLLHHIERLARHSVSHARLHTMKTKYSNILFLEAVFHSAKSILARFHFVCNGSAPLRLDWESPKTAALAKLEPKEVEFMKKTKAMVAAKEKEIRKLRNTYKYENTLYWSGQLFFGDFDTSPVHVVEGIEDMDRPVKAKK